MDPRQLGIPDRTLGQLGPIPDSLVEAIARAIANAEGFFVPGSLPARANNPGDLKMGDIGHGLLHDKTIYATVEEGWQALYRQVMLMLTGASKIYSPNMTLAQVAALYTGHDNPMTWAGNVARSLGVTVETKLADLVHAIPGVGKSGGGSPSPGTLAALFVGALLLFLALR